MGDHWLSEVPPSFLIYTQRYAGRFAHLKWGTGEEPVLLDIDKKHPQWCLGPRTLQVFNQNSTDFSLNWLCIDLTHIGRARREMVRPVPVLCRVWWAISHACLSLLRLPTLQGGWALVSQKVLIPCTLPILFPQDLNFYHWGCRVYNTWPLLSAL